MNTCQCEKCGATVCPHCLQSKCDASTTECLRAKIAVLEAEVSRLRCTSITQILPPYIVTQKPDYAPYLHNQIGDIQRDYLHQQQDNFLKQNGIRTFAEGVK
jgi:hypothetical protein